MERPSMERWSPSTTLVAPPPTGGYRYRWIAEAVGGQFVTKHVQDAIREGYSRVTIHDLHENHEDFVVDEDTGDGYARTGGLILMKISETFALQRQQHYLEKSQEASHAANVLQGIPEQNRAIVDTSRQLEGASQARSVAGSS